MSKKPKQRQTVCGVSRKRFSPEEKLQIIRAAIRLLEKRTSVSRPSKLKKISCGVKTVKTKPKVVVVVKPRAGLNLGGV